MAVRIGQVADAVLWLACSCPGDYQWCSCGVAGSGSEGSSGEVAGPRPLYSSLGLWVPSCAGGDGRPYPVSTELPDTRDLVVRPCDAGK